MYNNIFLMKYAYLLRSKINLNYNIFYKNSNTWTTTNSTIDSLSFHTNTRNHATHTRNSPTYTKNSPTKIIKMREQNFVLKKILLI